MNSLKKTKVHASIKIKVRANEFTALSCVSHCFWLKLDAYYKYKRKQQNQKQIIHNVKKIRRPLPEEGLGKLLKSLKQSFDYNT